MSRKKLTPTPATNKLPEEPKPEHVLPETLVERGWISLPYDGTACVVRTYDGGGINVYHRFQEGSYYE